MLHCIVFGLGFLIFGLVFSTGKCLKGISGWNRMPQKEQQAIRILPLCRNIGAVIGLAGILFLLGGFSASFREDGIRWAMLGWFVFCIGDLIYIHRSRRYVHPNLD